MIPEAGNAAAEFPEIDTGKSRLYRDIESNQWIVAWHAGC